MPILDGALDFVSDVVLQAPPLGVIPRALVVAGSLLEEHLGGVSGD